MYSLVNSHKKLRTFPQKSALLNTPKGKRYGHSCLGDRKNCRPNRNFCRPNRNFCRPNSGGGMLVALAAVLWDFYL